MLCSILFIIIILWIISIIIIPYYHVLIYVIIFFPLQFLYTFFTVLLLQLSFEFYKLGSTSSADFTHNVKRSFPWGRMFKLPLFTPDRDVMPVRAITYDKSGDLELLSPLPPLPSANVASLLFVRPVLSVSLVTGADAQRPVRNRVNSAFT